MERLTEHHVNKTLGAYMACSMACIKDDLDCTLCENLNKIVNTLAAYEDTGLTPEDANKMAKEWTTYETILSYVDEIGGSDRLLALIKAEKDGRLMVLPCKVGDTIFRIGSKEIITATVESIHQWCSGKWKMNAHTDKRHAHWVGYEISFDDFGKTVFLTREEAEAALKKREADDEAD